MPTVNLTVGTDADDGFWAEGSSTFDAAGVLRVGYHDGTDRQQNTFCRFTGVTIAKGSTISVATLTFRGFGSDSANNVNLRIRGLAEDNATAPTTYAGAEAKTRTTAAVDYNTAPAVVFNNPFVMPDITTVIQEIVNRAGWSSGNAMCIYVEDNASTASVGTERRFYSYAQSFPPTLDITYTAGGGKPARITGSTVAVRRASHY